MTQTPFVNHGATPLEDDLTHDVSPKKRLQM
jgi:hypothetical protein